MSNLNYALFFLVYRTTIFYRVFTKLKRIFDQYITRAELINANSTSVYYKKSIKKANNALFSGTFLNLGLGLFQRFSINVNNFH